MKPMTGATQALTIPPVQAADEDAILILEAQHNPAQFQVLYERWAAPIYRYFLFRTGDQPNAEDLTSQLFLSAYQALPRYIHRGHFAAWLFTIARHLALDFHRTHGRELPLELAEQAPAPLDLLADAAHSDEIRSLRRLIVSLPEEEQELIRLRYVGELSFADMAVVLSRKEDAVKKSLYRLQARLQSLLEQNHA
jgi:RNA polymerase sigma-70 factor, ECF subfamily